MPSVEFVGGPLDGDVRSVPDFSDFRVPILRAMKVLWSANEVPDDLWAPAYDVGVYKRRGSSQLYDWWGYEND